MAGGPKGITQFINTYQAGDTRLEDSWLMGQQFDAEGNPLYGVYDMAGEPLVFTKELPDGNFTSEMAGYRMNKYESGVLTTYRQTRSRSTRDAGSSEKL